MSDRRVRSTPHTPERRRERRCLRCQAPVPPRAREWSFCSLRCRVLWACDHPTLAGKPADAAKQRATEARVVAWVEARFQQARLEVRRASTFTVDPWEQRPAAGGRAWEDWGSEG